MNQGQYVFSQLVGHLDRNHFNYLARKYDGNKYVKHFSCWNQLLAMMFGQLSNRESLRDVVVALEAHHSKCKFLGIGSKPIAKTTLASANQNRDYRIFELVRNGQPIFWIFLGRNMLLILRPFLYVSLHFHGW